MVRICAIAFLFVAAIQARDRIPVLVELFTSEGCSSCPPADSLLAELEAKQPVNNVDLLVLSEHVDYWDQTGWKDPFSSSAFTARQQTYADRLRADDLYTPQAVIDGRYAVLGSNRVKVLQAVQSSSESPKPELAIAVKRQGNSLLISVPGATKGDVWMAVTEARTVSHVEHGENSGRTLQHVGVVRVLRKLKSGKARIQIEKNWGSDLRVVAFVQDSRSGRILQAAQKSI